VIPKPPFADELTREQELAAFDRLKPRLNAVWDVLSAQEDLPATSIVVPSFTLDQEELTKLDGAAFYEERLLFLLIRLRNPRAHVTYVTSQPVHPLILDYYLHLLAGVPASHARNRLTLLCCYDSSPRPLTQKILERPRLIERIRKSIPDHEAAYLTVFNSTPLERKLAVLLDVPLNGLDPELNYLGTKSGSRKVFKEAGVPHPAGYEDLKDKDDVERALVELGREQKGLRKAVVKLNESFSGEGNAVFTFPDSVSRESVHDAIEGLEHTVASETHDHYFRKFERMGGVVEAFIDAPFKLSPSAQLRTTPRGECVATSTHDQILGGPSGQIYQGCTFPAHEEYRRPIQDYGLAIGNVLAKHGAVSRFGVDFLVSRQHTTDPWTIAALEINLRVLGTTHPFLALQFLTGGRLDPETGLFLSLSGRAKYYMATDNLRAVGYRGVLPEDLIDIVTNNGLHYSYRTESGVLFHLIGALSQWGKLGVTVIANSHDEVNQLYRRTLEVLDREAGLGHAPAAATGRHA
jgi:hypothetical protein